MILRSRILILSVVLLFSAPARADTPDWTPWKPFLGEWAADAIPTSLGPAKAAVTFQLDLHDRVVIRRNHGEYAGKPGVAPLIHDDLMIVTPTRTKGQYVATYYDSEGHTILYACQVDGPRIVCTSTMPGPRFRLTLEPRGADRYSTKFEVAPENQEFKVYMEGEVQRKTPAP